MSWRWPRYPMKTSSMGSSSRTEPRTHLHGPRRRVAKITTRAVYLSVDSAGAEAYEEFHQLHISWLGLRGLLNWKHLGWKTSRSSEPGARKHLLPR